METTMLYILLACIHFCYGSHGHYSHTIPVENYDTELQDLGEHVEVPETPVRVVKITKTVAVKVPIPYPVKVVEKIPYPVHINKPYPVPVPQIIRVPEAVTPTTNHDEGFGHSPIHNNEQGNIYHTQEEPSYDRFNQNDYYGRNKYDELYHEHSESSQPKTEYSSLIE